jgi:TonB family protein
MSSFLRTYAAAVFFGLFYIATAHGAAPTVTSGGGDQAVVVPSSTIREAAHFKLDPEYPPAARQFRLGGEVVVDVTVGLDGKVENVVVTKGRPILNDAVVRAVRRWSFTPFIVDGRPRKVKSTLTFNFQL